MDLPIGSIIMWYKATSLRPVGWEVCDGNNGTPDLRGKFVIGASVDGDKVPVGNATHDHTNSVAQAANNHIHDITGALAGGASGAKVGVSGTGKTGDADHTHTIDFDTPYSGTHTHTTSNTDAANNLPPYVQVYYIMRTV